MRSFLILLSAFLVVVDGQMWGGGDWQARRERFRSLMADPTKRAAMRARGDNCLQTVLPRTPQAALVQEKFRSCSDRMCMFEAFTLLRQSFPEYRDSLRQCMHAGMGGGMRRFQ